MFLVEVDDASGQTAERCIRPGLNRPENSAKVIRKVPGSECQFRDRAQTASAATFDPPEPIRINARIRYPRRSIGRHDLRFQQRRGSRSIVFREAAESTALHEPGYADGRTASALNVTTSLGGYRIVGLHPYRARSDADRRLRRLFARTTLRNKRVVQNDVVHRPRPDEQRINRT